MVRRNKPAKIKSKSKNSEALNNLAKTKDIVILPVDKEKAMAALIAINMSEYKCKKDMFVKGRDTYDPKNNDPTCSVKTKLIDLLKKWKKDHDISSHLYDILFSRCAK